MIHAVTIHCDWVLTRNQDRAEARPFILRVLIKQIGAHAALRGEIDCCTRGFDREVGCFSLFERYVTVPVVTSSIAREQSFRSQCGRRGCGVLREFNSRLLAGCVNHSDSDWVETGKLSAKKALW